MIRKLDVPLEVKSVNESGFFTGYGSTFGNLDSYKDIMEKGAFKDTLKAWSKKGRMPAMLWQHDMRQPIGVYKEMYEDEKGLYVEGQLALKTRQGAEAFELMKMNALGGLSVGFMTKEEEYDHDTGVRKLKKIDLYELSLVTFPANEEAQIESVKEALRLGEVPAEREVEKVLRDAGFSRKQAKAFMAEGYRSLSQRDAGEDQTEQLAELKSSLDSLILKLRS